MVTTLQRIRIARCAALAAVTAMGFAVCVVVAVAQKVQSGTARGFKVPEYYEAKELGPGRTNQLKTLLVADQVNPRLDGTAQAQNVLIQAFDPDGRTNLIARAPACEVDVRRRLVSSPGRLKLQTGDGRFLIVGDGFLCRLTNASIVISNRVHTSIRKDTVPQHFRKP